MAEKITVSIRKVAFVCKNIAFLSGPMAMQIKNFKNPFLFNLYAQPTLYLFIYSQHLGSDGDTLSLWIIGHVPSRAKIHIQFGLYNLNQGRLSSEFRICCLAAGDYRWLPYSYLQIPDGKESASEIAFFFEIKFYWQKVKTSLCLEIFPKISWFSN